MLLVEPPSDRPDRPGVGDLPGPSAVAGEIERGTVDVTFSRPISRSAYLTSQVLFTMLGASRAGRALVLGNVIGNHVYTLKAPPRS